MNGPCPPAGSSPGDGQPGRLDGYVVGFSVEVVFDTSSARNGYDFVGTHISCGHCRQPVEASRDLNRQLANHARSHERQLSFDQSYGWKPPPSTESHEQAPTGRHGKEVVAAN